jgi:hypothetical protein
MLVLIAVWCGFGQMGEPMRIYFALVVLLLLAPVALGASAPVFGEPEAPEDPLAGLLPPLPAGPVSVPFAHPARDRLLPMVQAEAARQGVPPALADAVAMVETGYTENAVGTSGEIGLMQVMPATAMMLGFNDTMDKLFVPETNIHFGVMYLARAWAASGGNACRALMKYRAGVGEESYSPLSIQYCRRAGAWLAAQNSPLGLNVTQHTPALADAEDAHVINISGRAPVRADLNTFAAIVDIPGTVVEHAGGGGVWRARHQVATGRAAAVMAEIQDSNTDPHVIHIPASDP